MVGWVWGEVREELARTGEKGGEKKVSGMSV